MKIQQIVVSSKFQLTVDRDDLEALAICLKHTYHYGHAKIPKNLQSTTSQLMDAVDDTIRKDNEINRKVRSK